ncbi:MAG: DUF2934 domain-containing protein [Pseudomonadota bacterium]
MAATKTPTQKSKATSKPSDRGVISAKSKTKSAPETRKDAGPSISAEEREKLVARAAYFRAEKRGFAPGCELQDWVEAEAEVLRLIGSG